MTISVFVFLIIAGILAGIVSAVASMASLVSYPALLLVGTAPVVANVTNTSALIFTGVGSTLSSLKEMSGHWKELLKYAIFMVIGAIIGGSLLIRFPGKIFEKIVPFLVLISAGLLLLSGSKKFGSIRQSQDKKHKIVAYLGMVICGIYTGYFGAAAGVINLIVLSYLSDAKFIAINAMKNILGSLGNLVALCIFIFDGKVNWAMTVPLAIGLFIGGFLGQKSIKYLSPKAVRWITAIFSVFLAVYLYYSAQH